MFLKIITYKKDYTQDYEMKTILIHDAIGNTQLIFLVPSLTMIPARIPHIKIKGAREGAIPP